MRERWSTFRFRLGFAFRALRVGRLGLARRELQRGKPSAGDNEAVRIALVLARASSEAMIEAARTARRSGHAEGSITQGGRLDATLAMLTGVSEHIQRDSQQELERLGIR